VGSPGWRKVGLAAAGAAAFGVGMSVLKGNDGGAVRNAIGNLSAPWLALAFVAGAAAGGGRVIRGALVGALATFLALGGFYVANSFVLHLGPHPWLTDLRLAFGNGYFFKFAALSGPLFGGFGAWWGRTRSRPLAMLVAGLFVFEPLAWLAYRGADYTSDAVVWAAEAAVGIAAFALAARRAPPRRPPAS
jgi:hypothetical protein